MAGNLAVMEKQERSVLAKRQRNRQSSRRRNRRLLRSAIFLLVLLSFSPIYSRVTGSPTPFWLYLSFSVALLGLIIGYDLFFSKRET